MRPLIPAVTGMSPHMLETHILSLGHAIVDLLHRVLHKVVVGWLAASSRAPAIALPLLCPASAKGLLAELRVRLDDDGVVVVGSGLEAAIDGLCAKGGWAQLSRR